MGGERLGNSSQNALIIWAVFKALVVWAIEEILLPNYMGIPILCQYKDPYKPISIMECHKGFERCSFSSRNYGKMMPRWCFFSYAQTVAYLPNEMVDDHISHAFFGRMPRIEKASVSLGSSEHVRQQQCCSCSCCRCGHCGRDGAGVSGGRKWRKASNHPNFPKKKCAKKPQHQTTSISFPIFPHPSVGGFHLWILVGLKWSFMGWYGVVVDNLCIFGWREPIFNLHYRLVFQCLGSTQGTWYFRTWDRGISEDVGGIFNGKVQNYLWYHELVTPKKGFFYAFSKPLSLHPKENLSGSPTFQRLGPKTYHL